MNKTAEIIQFTDDMACKGVAHPDVQIFAQQMHDLGAPDGFLKRLASATTYITEAQLKKDIPLLAELTMSLDLLKNPYVLLTYLPKGSELWIMEQLQKYGVRSPDEIFPVLDYGINPPLDQKELEKLLKNRQAVMIDDWIITAGHVESINVEIEDISPLLVIALYTTKYAESKITNELPNVTFYSLTRDIPQLSKKTTRRDREFIESIYSKTTDRDGNANDGIVPSTTLLTGFHKRPDSIPSFLSGKRILLESDETIAPLFPDVIPPYRRSLPNPN